MHGPSIQARRLRRSERLKGDNGARIGNSGNGLDPFRDEMADVGRGLDIELDQEIEVPGRRINFGSDLGISELAGHVVCFAKLAFDLHEKRDHARLRPDPYLIPERMDCTSPKKHCRIGATG